MPRDALLEMRLAQADSLLSRLLLENIVGERIYQADDRWHQAGPDRLVIKVKAKEKTPNAHEPGTWYFALALDFAPGDAGIRAVSKPASAWHAEEIRLDGEPIDPEEGGQSFRALLHARQVDDLVNQITQLFSGGHTVHPSTLKAVLLRASETHVGDLSAPSCGST
jgi:hypothetical protein